MIHPDIRVIGFDADDTLWENETYFRRAEERFYAIMAEFGSEERLSQELYRVEVRNMPLYGFGIKAFMLSMVETTIKVSRGTAALETIEQIVQIGKSMLEAPVEMLPGVEEVLQRLSQRYRLVVATKGDLLDQERKLRKSGLAHYFHHVEIMSDKTVAEYGALLKHLDIAPHEFLMVGNSLKSDVLPVLEMGGYAVHVPFHTTWQHEMVDAPAASPRFAVVDNLIEIISHLVD